VEADEAVNYPTEFLNSLNLPGVPSDLLQLKIGVPIIVLRNIKQPQLCNGTRLAVKKFMSNVVEATILTGPFKCEDVLIPRIPMIPTDMPYICTENGTKKIFYTHKHSEIKHIGNVRFFSLLSLPLVRNEPQQRVAGYSQ
jgi:hypothetical protein